MIPPFEKTAKLGIAFVEWVNKFASTIFTDVDSLKSNVSDLKNNSERVLEQSKHFTDIDSKIVYMQEQLKLLERASQDNEVMAARGEFANLKARLDSLAPANRKVTRTFTSTAGQKTIDLTPTGKCDSLESIVLFLIDGAPQYNSFTWVDPYTLKMNDADALEADQSVVIQYFKSAVSMYTGHSSGHEVGGFDPLDVFKLKNGDVLQQQLQDVSKNSVVNVRDVVNYYGVPKNVLSNAASLIQQAINECSALDCWVVVPEGNYYLEKTLVAKKGLKMIVNKNATLYRYHTNNMLQNGTKGDVVGQSDILIDGGNWDVRGNLIDHDGSCFAFGYAKNITVRNAKVYNVNFSHGMELAAIEKAYVEYCGFYGFIDNTATRGFAESIQIESATTTGFPYFGNGGNALSKDIHITGCEAGASSVAGAWPVGVGTHSSPTVTVADTIFINDCDYRNVTHTGVVSNGYTNLYIEKTKIKARNGVFIAHDQVTKTNFSIRDCDITAIDGPGITLSGVSVGVVDHNMIDGYTNSIYITKSKEIDITNKNDLTSQTTDTITITDSCSDITTQRNIIRKAGRHGFNAYQNVSHLHFYGNEILDVTQNAFNFQGASNIGVVVDGNKIKDTSLNAVLLASSAVDSLVFTKNYYPKTLTNPIQSTATNATIADNKPI